MRLQLPAAVNMIIDVLQAHGYEGFAVGGCVRDSVLNRTPDDWDITTSATPYQVKELFPKTVDTGLPDRRGIRGWQTPERGAVYLKSDRRSETSRFYD